MMYPEQWENLANAIIEKAVDDYRAALKNLKLDPNNHIALRDKKEIEEFFHSKRFSRLTNLDGDWLMNRIREEANDI